MGHKYARSHVLHPNELQGNVTMLSLLNTGGVIRLPDSTCFKGYPVLGVFTVEVLNNDSHIFFRTYPLSAKMVAKAHDDLRRFRRAYR